MTRPTDRGSDPSAFAWIFGGALALIGLGSVLRASRRRREDMIVSRDEGPAEPGLETAEETVEGHPS